MQCDRNPYTFLVNSQQAKNRSYGNGKESRYGQRYNIRTPEHENYVSVLRERLGKNPTIHDLNALRTYWGRIEGFETKVGRRSRWKWSVVDILRSQCPDPNILIDRIKARFGDKFIQCHPRVRTEAVVPGGQGKVATIRTPDPPSEPTGIVFHPLQPQWPTVTCTDHPSFAIQETNADASSISSQEVVRLQDPSLLATFGIYGSSGPLPLQSGDAGNEEEEADVEPPKESDGDETAPAPEPRARPMWRFPSIKEIPFNPLRPQPTEDVGLITLLNTQPKW